MVVVGDRIDGWWNETDPPQCDSAHAQSLGSSTLYSGKRDGQMNRQGEVCLDNAFALIDAPPATRILLTAERVRHPPLIDAPPAVRTFCGRQPSPLLFWGTVLRSRHIRSYDELLDDQQSDVSFDEDSNPEQQERHPTYRT
jgi:hypothetical protein